MGYVAIRDSNYKVNEGTVKKENENPAKKKRKALSYHGSQGRTGDSIWQLLNFENS